MNLGFEHILDGLDHLLFLMAAATLLAAWRRAPRLALAALFLSLMLDGKAETQGGKDV